MSNHWQLRKPMWAFEKPDGTLAGSGGIPWTYDRRKEAVSIAKYFMNSRLKVVKVRVKYERL